jgi:hypothetical protein
MSMSEIQMELKAPKSQYNSFGKYNYRSCEDIIEAVKPILAKYSYHLNISDDVVQVGDRIYIKAYASVCHGDKIIQSATALAREPEDKKGMDASQITGTSSSYARKYALNGLFAIDDNQDNDVQDVVIKKQSIEPERLQKAIAKIKAGDYTVEKLKDSFSLTPDQLELIKDL